MDIVLGIGLIIAFIATVSAYLMGVRHGLSVSRGRVPRPIHDAIQPIKTAIKPKEVDEMEETIKEIMNYNFDDALKSLKREG